MVVKEKPDVIKESVVVATLLVILTEINLPSYAILSVNI